jgi:hypothetical protein
MQKQPQRKKKNKTARLGLVLLVTLAGTAVVGWGGLAAWQAYTENDGNSVAAGTLQHKNTTSATCTSVTTLPSTGCASVWVAVSSVSPSSTSPFASGTVKVSNTGTLNSTFRLATVTAGSTTVTAPAGSLCADLNLQITSLNASGTEVVYNGPMNVAINAALNNNAPTPSATWSSGGATPGGSGATGNTFSFTVTPGAAFATNSADQGTSCNANFQFQQTNA